MAKCGDRNGTYVCDLPKGHKTRHSGKTPNMVGRAALMNKRIHWPNKSLPWHKRGF